MLSKSEKLQYWYFRILYLVQDPKKSKSDRNKIEEKWKILTKQATIKNPNFKEPVGMKWFEPLFNW